ncbi:MAG TPA: DUF1707 domain-containing protein, partial [Thermopolyspora sp.]
DADRERVAAALRDAVADGRLTLGEHEERVERAYRAKTLGELTGLTTDLLPPHLQPVRTDQGPVSALFRPDKREGRWVVPSRYPATAIGTTVTLDLTDALLQTGHVTIDATVIGGTLTLIVPEGVRVIIAVTGALVGKKNQVRADAVTPDGPVIEIVGRVMFGNIIAKSPKRPRRGLFRRQG